VSFIVWTMAAEAAVGPGVEFKVAEAEVCLARFYNSLACCI